MIATTLDLGGLDRRLEHVAGAMRDLRPAWGAVQEIFVAFMKELFATQGGYVGEAWEPLSPGYAAWKARHAPDKSILRLRDRLYGSLTSTASTEHVYRTGPSFAEMGTRVAYAVHHQTGTRRMPARPPIKAFSRAEGERVADVILAHLLRETRRARR
jgi:phage gpG-like protein